ncbi:MAG: hypothetical protein IKN72_07895 [Clostridia bacterium]|nr:hypothetical protein [Clostridia bacterium]
MFLSGNVFRALYYANTFAEFCQQNLAKFSKKSGKIQAGGTKATPCGKPCACACLFSMGNGVHYAHGGGSPENEHFSKDGILYQFKVLTF